MAAPSQRRMNLSDLLDAAGKLYMGNLALFLGTIGVVAVIELILGLLLGRSGDFIARIVSIIGWGALIQAISARYLGRNITIPKAYSTVAVSTFAYLVVAMIIYYIAVGIGFVLIILPGIYLLVRFLFVPQAIVVERAEIFQAFSRSSELVQGNWWRIFGYGFVLLLLLFLLEVALGAAFGYGVVVSFLIEVFVLPFALAVLTLLYFDLRREKGETIAPGTVSRF